MTRSKRFRRILSLFIAFVLALSSISVPVSAAADEDDGESVSTSGITPTATSDEDGSELVSTPGITPDNEFGVSLEIEPTDAEDPKRFWEFDSDVEEWKNGWKNGEGWVAGGFIEGSCASNGTKEIYTDDEALNIPIGTGENDNRYIVIRLKNNTNSTSGKIYFNTNENKNWAYEVSFPIERNSDYIIYYIDMSKNANWKNGGSLKGLDIYPAGNATSGTYSIDYIRLLTRQEVSTSGSKVWDFDSGVGEWTKNDGFSVECNNGTVKGTLTGKRSDFYTDYLENLGVPIGTSEGDNKWLSIKLKNNTNASQLGIEYATLYNTGWSDKGTISIEPNSDYKIYNIDMSWLNGDVLKVLNIYLKEGASGQTFEIDYIKLGPEKDDEGDPDPDPDPDIDPTNLPKYWEFSTDGQLEGWTQNTGISAGVTSAGGTISGTVTTTNAEIYTDEAKNLNILIGKDESDNKNLSIRLKNGTTSSQMKIVFMSRDKQSWTVLETISITPSSSNFEVYNVDFSSNGNWIDGDVLKGLNLVFVGGGSGNFEIDYIRLVPYVESDVNNVSKFWEFSSGVEEWSEKTHIPDYGLQTSGFVGGTINRTNSYNAEIYTPDMGNVSLEIPIGKGIDDNKYITVRMKNSTSANTARIFFIMQQGNWDNYVDFEINPNDSGYTEYEINMSKHPGWANGKIIRALGLYPAIDATSGTVSLDYIRIQPKSELPIDDDISSMSDESFFGKWSGNAWTTVGKLDYENFPALNAVESAAKAGNYTLAKVALLDYYDDRNTRKLLPLDPLDRIGVLRAELQADFIFFCNEEYPLDVVKFNSASSVQTADVTEGVVRVISMSNEVGFMLMARKRTEYSASISSKEGTNPPQLVVTFEDNQTQSFTPSKDSWINAGTNATQNHGTDTAFQIHESGNADNNTKRAYIVFDLLSLEKKTISKVELKLHGSSDSADYEVIVNNSGTLGFMENELTWENAGISTLSFQGHEDEIPWNQRITNTHDSTNNDMLRFTHMPYMAAAYNQENKTEMKRLYADSAVRIWINYISNKGNANASPLRGLDLAARMGNMLSSYQYLRASDSLSPSEHSTIIKHFWQMGEALTESRNYDPNNNNWAIAEGEALFKCAIYFPEFKASADTWLEMSKTRINAAMVKLVGNDGSYYEATASYAAGAMGDFMKIKKLGTMNEVGFDNFYDTSLRKLTNYIMDLTRPDGVSSAFGDADAEEDLIPYLKTAYEVTGWEDVQYFITNGAGGTHPGRTTAYYPDGKAMFMRTGYSLQDMFMAITMTGSAHGHPDLNNITAYAYGKSLLTDPGIYMYGDSPITYWLQKTTEAHNTIEVDGKAQSQSNRTRNIYAASTNEIFDFYEGEHNGYSTNLHKRDVLFLRNKFWIVSDKVGTDGSDHSYKQTWHYTPNSNVAIDQTTKATKSAYTSGANLQIIPADPEKLTATKKAGYVAPYWGMYTNADYIAYEIENTTQPVTFDTVLYPTKQGDSTEVTVTRLDMQSIPTTTATALQINLGTTDKGYYYLSHEASPTTERTFGDYSFNGKTAYVETGSASNYVLATVKGGTVLKKDAADIISSPSEIADIGVQWSADGTVLDISGTDLVASKSKKGIAIYAPSATTVTLNGEQVAEFTKEGNYIYAVRYGGANTLTVEAGTGGSITTAPSGSYFESDTVTMTAQANGGYTFAGWTYATDVKVSDPFTAKSNLTTDFTMPDGNCVVTANFTKDGGETTYGLTFKTEYGGEITSTNLAQYPAGAKVTIAAGATVAGYHFAGWEATGVSLSSASDSITSFTMPSGAVELTAKFALHPVAAAFPIAQYPIGPSASDSVIIEYDLTLNKTGAAGSVVFSDSAKGAIGTWANMPIIIQVNDQGKFQAYKSNNYVASNLSASVGNTYRVRLMIDLSAKKYSVWITPSNESETQIANNYEFRSSATAPTKIDSISLVWQGTMDSTPAFTVRNITVSGPTQLTIDNPTLTKSKVYDRETTATVTAGTLSGFQGGYNNATVNATATYDNKTVGTGKTITVKYSISGDDAYKYLAPVDYVANDGVITEKDITITGVTATYNPAATAGAGSITLNDDSAQLNGVISSDVVTLNKTGATGSISGATANESVAVLGYKIEGTDAVNYKLIQPTGLTVDATVTIDPTLGAKAELAKLTAVSVTGVTVAYGANKTTVEAAIAAKAALVSGFDATNYDVTFAATSDPVTTTAGSINVPGKFTVTHKSEGTNTAANASDVTISVTVEAQQPTVSATPTFNTNLAATKSLNAGETLTLTVTATVTDDGTLSYEWFKGSSSLGNNSNTFTISNAQVSDSGSYKVKVTNTKGGLTPTSVESEVCTVTVSTIALAQVQNAALSATGQATWTNLTSETGVANYSIKLYKNSSNLVDTKTSATTTGAAGVSFLSEMRAAGEGTYTVKVTAIGNGTTHSDGPESAASGSQTVAKLGTPTNLAWSGTNATFDKLASETGVANYLVTVTGGGTPANGGVAAVTGSNLSVAVSGLVDDAKFKVQVKALTTGLYLDSDESGASGAYVAPDPAAGAKAELAKLTAASVTGATVSVGDNKAAVDAAIAAKAALVSGFDAINYNVKFAATGTPDTSTAKGITVPGKFTVTHKTVNTATNTATNAADVTISVTVNAPVKTVTVGLQTGKLLAGKASTVTYEITTANIADGEYDVTVQTLPTGVTAQGGKVTIANNRGTLTLAGDTTTTAATTATLTLTIDGTTSAAFSLAILEPAASVTVTGAENKTTVKHHETLQMAAAVLPANAADKTVTWSVTDNGGNATELATISESGLLTANGVGKVTVTATAKDGSGVTGTLEITIEAVPVTGITIKGKNNATTITTDKGTLQMSADITPSNATDKTVTWSVENVTGIAGIDQDGLLTAFSDGTVKVTATANDGSGVSSNELEITISNQTARIPVQTITVRGAKNATKITAEAGTLQMSATVAPNTASDKSVTWSVENGTGEATISTTGLLTAVKNGTVTVIATAGDGSGVTGTLVITISNQIVHKVNGISVTPNTLNLKKGEQRQFVATVNVDGRTPRGVTWQVAGGKAGTTIDNDGLLKVAADETATTLTVTATSEFDGKKSDTATVTVFPKAGDSNLPAKLELSEKTLDVNKGTVIRSDYSDNAKALKLTLKSANNSTISNLQPEFIIWESNEPAIVSVDEETGAVTAVSPGTATITARYADNAAVTDYCRITVAEVGEAETTDQVIKLESDRDEANKKYIMADPGRNDLYTITGNLLDTRNSENTADAPITLTVTNDKDVTWKTGDSKVVAIKTNSKTKNREVQITYKGTGTTVITATSTAKKGNALHGKSSTVVITVGDVKPKVPVTSLTVFKDSAVGTEFEVLPSDNFTFNKDLAFTVVKVLDNKKKAVANPETLFSAAAKGSDTDYWNLNATGAAVGRYTVTLKAANTWSNSDTSNPRMGEFDLAVNVLGTVPSAKLKMPTLNTFWKNNDASPNGLVEGLITITGSNLPKITELVLSEDVRQNFRIDKRGDNFYIVALDSFGKLDSKGKPIVKGDIIVKYEGFSQDLNDAATQMQTIKNFTIPIRPVAPKIRLAVSSLTVNKTIAASATYTVTGLGDAKIANVRKVEPAFAGNAVIADAVTNTDDTFTVSLNNPATAKASNGLRLNVTLANARTPVQLNPTVKTSAPKGFKLSPNTLTFLTKDASVQQQQTVTLLPDLANDVITFSINDITAIVPKGKNPVIPPDPKEIFTVNGTEITVTVDDNTTPGTHRYEIKPAGGLKDGSKQTLTVKVDNKKMLAVSLKAQKGNINLMDRGNTQLTYVPTVKNSMTNIVKGNAGVRFVASATTGKPAAVNTARDHMDRAIEKLDAVVNSDGNIVVTAKPDSSINKGESFRVKLELTLDDGNTAESGVITIRPAQTAVRLAIPRSTVMYQSRTDVNHHVIIDLTPTTPTGAKIATLKFKDETAKNLKASKYVNNPNNAYWYSFGTYNGKQELHIWIQDPSRVKIGRANLTFSVTYEGQGLENVGTKAKPVMNPKPIDLRIPVSVAR